MCPTGGDELEYEMRARVDEDQLRAKVQEIWREEVLADRALRAQLQLKQLGPAPGDPTSPFGIQLTAGVEPASATLLVTLGITGVRVGSKVLLDIWSRIILPRLLKKYGSDSLKDVKAGRHK
jgi:hypothetical protein